MTTLSPHLSLNLNQPRWVCVLDLSLVLSHHGLSLTKHLGDLMELWVVRELWHILDNTQFYLQQPVSVLFSSVSKTSPDIEPATRQEVIRALQDWEKTRIATDPVNLKLFWIGDRPSESFLPGGTDPQLTCRWESLARSLDTRLNRNAIASDILNSSFRDTAALSIALQSAFILTYQPLKNYQSDRPPDICIALESWGIPCQEIDPLDAIAAIERENLRQIIVQAGLSKFLWAGLRLAVLHLVLPSTSALFCETSQTRNLHFPNTEDDRERSAPIPHLWEGAQGFWHRI
jgi:hypothetical protein